MILVVLMWDRIPHIFKRKQRIVSVNTKLWQNKNLQLTTLQVAKDDISKLLSPRDRLTTEDTENPAKSLPYLRSKIGWCGGRGGGGARPIWSQGVTNLTQLLIISYFWKLFVSNCNWIFYNDSFFSQQNIVLLNGTQRDGWSFILTNETIIGVFIFVKSCQGF